MSKVQDTLQGIYKKSGTKNVAVEEVEDIEGELLNEGLLGAAGGAILGHMAAGKKGAVVGAATGHMLQKRLEREEDESEELEDEEDKEVEEGLMGTVGGAALGTMVPGVGTAAGMAAGGAIGHMVQKHIEKREEDESEDYEENDEDKEVEEECVGPGMMKKENAKIKEQVMGALEREEASNKK